MVAKKVRPGKPGGAIAKRVAIKEEVHEQAQLGLPRRLASCDKKVRDRAVDLLARWLECRQDVDDADLKKIWKGLFYCVWHADKAPVQADLADRLASLLARLKPNLGVRFFEVFLGTMRREWGGIDHLRLDKFYLLLRKFVGGMFKALKQQGWDRELVGKYMDALRSRAFLTDDLFPAQGVSMHLAGTFLDEMKSFLPLEADVFGLMLDPFYSVLARTLDKTLLKRVKECVFGPLLNEAFNAAKLRVEGNENAECELGFMILALSIDDRLFQLAASEDLSQGNRNMLFSLYEDFKKLKKIAAGNKMDKTIANGANDFPAKNGSGDVAGNGTLSGKKKKSAKKSPKAGSVEVNKSNAKKAPVEADPMVIEPVTEQDPVVSNLESKFDVVAAGENDASPLPPLEMVLSPLIVGSKRKSKKKKQAVVQSDSPIGSPLDSEQDLPPTNSSGKKRKNSGSGATASVFQVAVSPLNTASKKRKSSKESPGESGDVWVPQTNEAMSNSMKKGKKVRFALRKNTVWKPTSPSSSVPLRPSSSSLTPKGSALKKGLSPGPIRRLSPRSLSPKNKKKPSPKRIF